MDLATRDPILGLRGRRVLPPLAALRAFEAAARLGSFRAAAEELTVTQSAISHQIAGLERRLGAALFRRRARRVELSEAGAAYYPFLRDAFDRIAQGTGLVARQALAGELMVQVYVTVAVKWLIPRLHRFQAAEPEILVRMSTNQLDWEFDPATGDLGIICTAKPDRPNLHYAHLFDARLFPVCSPALAQAGTGLRQPAELVNHTLLQLYTAEDDWRAWLDAAGVPQLAGRAAPQFDSYLLALEAAIEGQGIALIPHFMVGADLKAGRLLKPFTVEVRQPGRWYLVCRRERRGDARILRFLNWLEAEIAGDPVMR
jgi:LysR family transcriptional regulator, glycine cleavage system transcriptional activator